MKRICFVTTLTLLAAAIGCKPQGQTTVFDVDSSTISCGFEPHEGKLNHWVFMRAKDKKTGQTLFGLGLYASEIGMSLSPKGELEVDGKNMKLPPSDGFIYLISESRTLSKAPVTVDEFLSLGDAPHTTELWKTRLFPMIQRFQWKERLN